VTDLPLFNLGWVDLTMLAVLAVSVIIGLVRGLVFEMLSVVGWFAAYFAAQWFSPLLAPYLPIGAAGSPLNSGAAFATTFVVALIAWGLLTRLLRMLIRATPLSLVDRVMGAGFGLARGMILLLAVATVVGLTPLQKTPAWQQSTASGLLASALRGIKPMLPQDIAKHLPA
jgi:membrane protein required for colicin V production